MSDADDAEVRRLRGQVHRLEEDTDDLRARLAYAHLEIEHLRARLIEVTRPMGTAAPRDMQSASLVPVTAAELDAALARLRQVRPLSVA
jgi:hypothetical protein